MAAKPFAPRGYRTPSRQEDVAPITASLISDGVESLDLHAEVALMEGGGVRYTGSKQTQSIFWKRPFAGEYSITVQASAKCGITDAGCSFRVVLAGEGQPPFEMDSCLKWGAVECFRFMVAEDGAIRSCQILPQEEDSSDTVSTKAPSEAE